LHYPTISAILFHSWHVKCLICTFIGSYISPFLCQTLSRIGMLSIVSFWIRSRDPFWPTRLRLDSILQKNFIWLGVPHETCSIRCVDEFRFLNHLISISEAQDILVWISNMKADNPAARRILTRVCRSDSRSKWDHSFAIIPTWKAWHVYFKLY
jgi:hypothetical protein